MPAKSEDKRARLDAGLDLELGWEIQDTQLEHVVKEVGAPKSKLELLDSWVTDIATFLTSKPLAKTSSLPLPPAPVLEGKFHGAKVISCSPSGPLASKTLVFPKAEGRLLILLAPCKPPTDLASFHNSCLAVLRQKLHTSDLVEEGSLSYQQDLWSSLSGIILRPRGKLAKYLEVTLEVEVQGLEQEARRQVVELESEVRPLLASCPSYKTLVVALQVWCRQVHLLAPPGLLEVVVLHLHLTQHLTQHMKAWQGLRKVWGWLASSPQKGHDVILGVEAPVPSSSSCCPLLDRAGTLPLFPLLPLTQWQLLVVLATRAQGQGVEQALLTATLPEAFYDRIFEVSRCDVVPSGEVVASLTRGLGARARTLGVVGGSRSWGQGGRQLSVRVGIRLDPANYWQPTTLGPEQEEHEACADFRKFWGDRSELRRFQDGVVREVVVWGGAREEVLGDVVRAVVARHHGGCEVAEEGGWGEALLQGDGGAAARAVLDALVPEIYGLEKLPLAVSGVAGTGPSARGSRVGEAVVRRAGGKTVRQEGEVCLLSGKGGMAPSSLEPLDVVLSAEHSGEHFKAS